MVKRREPPSARPQPTEQEIEAFAAGAEGGTLPAQNPEKPLLDPHANRDYKGIRVPFNEYEYRKLEWVSTKTGRTKLNVIRTAILKMAEELEQENTHQQGTK
jgi:hypothetical protein